jgi:hypothetical protein
MKLLARRCLHTAAAAALAWAAVVPAHAIVTTSVSGNTTTYLENFNGGSSFSNPGGTWFNDVGSDDYLWLSIIGASASYSFTVPAGGAITLDFDYAGPWSNGNGTVHLAGPPQSLGDTPGSWVDFLVANPGGASNYDTHYNATLTGLAAGTYALTFAAAATSMLKIDDVSIAVTAVPEPAAVAMLLAGLGVIGAVVRRQRAG